MTKLLNFVGDHCYFFSTSTTSLMVFLLKSVYLLMVVFCIAKSSHRLIVQCFRKTLTSFSTGHKLGRWSSMRRNAMPHTQYIQETSENSASLLTWSGSIVSSRLLPIPRCHDIPRPLLAPTHQQYICKGNQDSQLRSSQYLQLST